MTHLSPKVRERFHSGMRIVVDYLAEGRHYVPTNQTVIHEEALLRLMCALIGNEEYEKIAAALTETEKKKVGQILE